jgi:ribonuclease P protein subunit RPR2
MPRKQYYKKPDKQVKIAKKRIEFLFEGAKNSFKKDSKLSDKYIRLARKIAMKYKTKLSSELKKRFCRNCGKYMVQGVNCRVRIHKHRIIYYCLNCKHYARHPLK